MLKKLIMNLQLFAEGAESQTNTEGSTSTGTEGTTVTDGATEKESIKSFDDVLKDKAYQSEFDRRVNKALETAKSKWETEKATELENAKTEAQKLAKMNADQKAQYEQEKRIKELERREKDINARELKAQAYETLAEKSLPKELIDTLNFNDADSCNKSIEAVEKAFQIAVEKAVNDKLRGGNPPKGGQNNNSSDAALRAAFGLK